MTSVHSTHIRGGNIRVSVISTEPLVVLFEVSLYRDSDAIVPIGNGQLDFWDGVSVNLRVNADSVKVKYLGNQIEEYIFYISHAYPHGTVFISPFYFEGNRNPGTVNLQNSSSIAFLIETQAFLVAGGRINNSPIFLIPPKDEGVIGELFIHNVGAFDPDGDSLSYELITPFQQKEKEVAFYDLPDSSWIDKFGNLHWDLPLLVGQYTYVIKVTEWRFIDGEWKEIGFVMRDMQVYIRDLPNKPPTITPNGAICVLAGNPASMDMVTDDPNGDQINVELFSELSLNPSEYSIFPSWDDPLPGGTPINYTWITDCKYVRKTPYLFYFKVTDNFPGTQLSGISVWNVQLVGPPMNLGSIAQNNKSAQLNWESACEGTNLIEIWRSTGSVNPDVGNCQAGMPENSGYVLVDEVDATMTTYVDNNHGIGLFRGGIYCYRIISVWPDGTKSIISNELCVTIPVDAPVITKTSVTETDTLVGVIDLKWTSSFDLPSNPTDNFVYQLNYQSENASNWIELEITSDTVARVPQLNTEQIRYNFQINIIKNNQLKDSSNTATSVFLVSSSAQSMIDLSWNAEVPWDNLSASYPHHYIFRNRLNPNDPESFYLLDSVNVLQDGMNYQDSTEPETPLFGFYSYYIKTQGTYGNYAIGDPLINNSQIVEQLAFDRIPPCPPILEISNGTQEDCVKMIGDLGCSAEFHNDLLLSKSCEENDFSLYEIYHSFTHNGLYEPLSESRKNEFIHAGLSSLAGCYYAVSIDYSGNKSRPSEAVCRDNCLTILLPNVFTPNGDNINDYFTIIETQDGIQTSCLQFIEQIDFIVVDRSGIEILKKSVVDPESFSKLWDGFDSNKNKVATGIYYYHAYVSYKSLDFQVDEMEGWVQVLY